MNHFYFDFLDKVIADCETSANTHYSSSPSELESALNALKTCKAKTPGELKDIYESAVSASREARFEKSSKYTEIRCHEIEVEFICDAVSAILVNSGEEPILGKPTKKGFAKAHSVVKFLNNKHL